MRRVWVFPLASTGSSSAARIPMMETTTNNSVNVNPDRLDTAWSWRPGLDIFAFGMV